MCIRDRYDDERIWATMSKPDIDAVMGDYFAFTSGIQASGCLLYTSDAADERSSVDLGGRRIIKKKKRVTTIKSEQKTTQHRVQ